MANSKDCTAWVGRIIRERNGFERKFKDTMNLLDEANKQIEALKVKVAELEERLASTSYEITLSSN